MPRCCVQAAASLPAGGISEIGMNAALALIEGATPTNESEGALAIQTARTHATAKDAVTQHDPSITRSRVSVAGDAGRAASHCASVNACDAHWC
jgi:hypothetical protein